MSKRPKFTLAELRMLRLCIDEATTGGIEFPEHWSGHDVNAVRRAHNKIMDAILSMREDATPTSIAKAKGRS